MTEKTDWGATILGAVASVAGVAGAAAAIGASAINVAANAGGAAAGSAFGGTAGREDSIVFSQQIRESLGDWKFISVFQTELEAAIKAKTIKGG
jgi:hypothetical protein